MAARPNCNTNCVTIRGPVVFFTDANYSSHGALEFIRAEWPKERVDYWWVRVGAWLRDTYVSPTQR